MNRALPWDWYPGTIPPNAWVDQTAYIETTYSFLLHRSELAEGVQIGRGSTAYMGTMFDVGPRGQVIIGQYALIHGAWFICDARIEIGDYGLISWNVVFMDSYGAAFDPAERRRQLQRLPACEHRWMPRSAPAQPIRVGRNVWIGFGACVLPGVTIGDGSIVGARSVVAQDVPPFTVVAGNPARIIRQIENDERTQTQ